MNIIPPSFPTSGTLPIIVFKLSTSNNSFEIKIQLIYINKNSISTSHRKQSMPIKGTSQVILCRKIIYAYFKNKKSHIHKHAQYIVNSRSSEITADGEYTQLWGLTTPPHPLTGPITEGPTL